MTSLSKKKKAKNSYLHNGWDKRDGKFKRYAYYTKRQRKESRKQVEI